MPLSNRILLLTLIFVTCAFSLKAQQRIDTTRTHQIDEVIILENEKIKELRSTTPLQSLNISKLKQQGAIQVSDAAKLFSGVVVKDYGGIGGLKTISIRSLGAAHTAIAYDGITITDAQTGQIDLGKLSLDNIDLITLNSGQSDNIFQSARLFSAAGVLQLKTTAPKFHNKKINGKASVKAGSFGLINPNIRINNKWNDIFSSSISIDYLHIDGNYPYTNKNGEATEKRKRENSDVESIKTEANIYGNLSENQRLNFKLYYYGSERGMPTNILYNSYAGQRLWDKNFFVQTNYENKFHPKWSILGNAKFNRSHSRYEDPSIHNIDGFSKETYYQNEYYLSGTILYKSSPNLSFSLANDGSLNHMRANLTDFSVPTRFSLLNALAVKFVKERFTATAHVLSTATKETVKYGTAANNRYRLSPSVSFSYQPFSKEELRFRFFYKDIFRLPSFNDLYYGTIGTRNLKPEKAQEYNIGFSWMKSPHNKISFSLSADAFYNRINDKIIAIPGKNLFIWSMMNVGRVDIKGIETNADMNISFNNDIQLLLSGNYTYQRAQDKTNKHMMPDKVTYNHQIPYTPRHSGSVRVGIETSLIHINYTLMASGERYSNQYNSTEYRLENYMEHSVSAFRSFKFNKIELSAQFEVLNLLNKQYEIVKNYPMPGRQFRGNITISY